MKPITIRRGIARLNQTVAPLRQFQKSALVFFAPTDNPQIVNITDTESAPIYIQGLIDCLDVIREPIAISTLDEAYEHLTTLFGDAPLLHDVFPNRGLKYFMTNVVKVDWLIQTIVSFSPEGEGFEVFIRVDDHSSRFATYETFYVAITLLEWKYRHLDEQEIRDGVLNGGTL